MEAKNRFFYANSKLKELTLELDNLGYTQEEKMVESKSASSSVFFDRLDKEYFFVEVKNLKNISEIIRNKYSAELNISTPSSIFGYENPESTKERRKRK